MYIAHYFRPSLFYILYYFLIFKICLIVSEASQKHSCFLKASACQYPSIMVASTLILWLSVTQYYGCQYPSIMVVSNIVLLSLSCMFCSQSPILNLSYFSLFCKLVGQLVRYKIYDTTQLYMKGVQMHNLSQLQMPNLPHDVVNKHMTVDVFIRIRLINKLIYQSRI